MKKITGKKLIGLSLSRCISDIIHGKVEIRNVKKIITGTKYADGLAWTKAIKSHCSFEWESDPDGAESIVWQFLEEGRIEQPRLECETRFPATQWGKGNGIFWVTDESQIVWNERSPGEYL
jgi:hypothetical protein